MAGSGPEGAGGRWPDLGRGLSESETGRGRCVVQTCVVRF